MSQNANEAYPPLPETGMGRIVMQQPPMWVQLQWGEAVIQFYEDGRLVVEGCPTMDAAAIAFWRAVQRWTPAGITVTLPDGYGT